MNKLDKKFNNLKRKYGIPKLSKLNSDDIIFNYSHRVLSEVEKKVLARGLRFCLPPKEVDTYEVKCSLELLFREVDCGLGKDINATSSSSSSGNDLPWEE